jgi:hypothetical protein
MVTRNRFRDIHQDIQESIADLVVVGWSNGEKFLAAFVEAELKKNPKFRGRVPLQRTLQRRVKELIPNVEKVRDLDQPFEWHRLEVYKLPWEAGSYLLSMWREIQELRAQLNLTHLIIPRRAPTVRQARWWWRVHLAVPEMEDKLNVYLWAKEACKQELYRDLLGKPLNLSGFNAYLAYQPWANAENEMAYTTAWSEGRVAPPPIPFEEFVGDVDSRAEALDRASKVGEYLGDLPGGIDGLNPGKLPVEIMYETLDARVEMLQELKEKQAKISQLEAETPTGEES